VTVGWTNSVSGSQTVAVEILPQITLGSGGIQVINTPNPVNPQDLATKNYVDTYRNQFGPYVPLWENDYSMQCGSANFTNGTTHMTTGPTDQTITKLYPDTAIRVIASLTCYINVASSFVRLQCAVGGGVYLDMSGLFGWGTGEHAPLPTVFHYFSPTISSGGIAAYPQVNTTGPMAVVFAMYVSTASTTVSTDANDIASWTIAECKVS
jgi:hypothetical protein